MTDWDALYLSAQPESEDEAWLWLGMLLAEHLQAWTDYEKEKRWARAQELFAYLQERQGGL